MAWDLSDVPVYDAKARCVPQSGHRLEKPEPRTRTKARKDRVDAKLLKAFRDRVWIREAEKFFDYDEGDPLVYGEEWARCQHCLVVVHRSAEVLTGHVHHRRGRNVAPEDRYNPDAAVLFCATCHRAVHDHRMTV